MELIQITPFLTLGAYLTVVCFFFYKLNEKTEERTNRTIAEWREEHKAQMNAHKEDIQRVDAQHREDMRQHKEDMQKMDEKWERLFEKFIDKLK